VLSIDQFGPFFADGSLVIEVQSSEPVTEAEIDFDRTVCRTPRRGAGAEDPAAPHRADRGAGRAKDMPLL